MLITLACRQPLVCDTPCYMEAHMRVVRFTPIGYDESLMIPHRPQTFIVFAAPLHAVPLCGERSTPHGSAPSP